MSTEVELKLAFWPQDAARIASVPWLKRRRTQRIALHAVYYDTPDGQLRQRKIALRVRRDVHNSGRRWVQTLKAAGDTHAALTTRGEWEQPVRTGALDAAALASTPWPEIDPDGTLFNALTPQFATHITRTLWTLRNRSNGSVIELALDAGYIQAGAQRLRVAEVELELQRGEPAQLWAVARDLAQHVALIPASASKAQQGYALAQGVHGTAVSAQPPTLVKGMTVPQAARVVLGEMLAQCCANLIHLRTSDAPALVHQARVGWRRFRSALKLFRPALQEDLPPATPALQPLFTALGRWRDVDVMAFDTLPRWKDAYQGQDPARHAHWNTLQELLFEARVAARSTTRHILHTPAVGAAFTELAAWLHSTPAHGAAQAPLDVFAHARIARLRKRIKHALAQANDLDAQHEARILAKRARYGVEAFDDVLPKAKAKRWRSEAAQLQTTIGTERDTAQAASLATLLGADAALIAFLQGISAAQRA
jgi:inorganic triphosphatase YgiF